MQLVNTQTRQLSQTHINDGLRLQLVQVETALQITLCISRSLTVTNDVYNLVDIVDSDNQSLQDMSTLLCFLQVVLGSANGDIMTMLHEILHALLQRQQTRTSFHQRNIVDRERALQCRHLEQLVQEHIGIGITLHVYDDTHTLTARLVIHVGHTFNLMLGSQVGDISHQIGLVDTIRNLCDHNLIVRFATLDLSLGTHHDTSTTSLVSVFHTLQTIDIGACWEVRTRDVLHQSFCVDIRVVDISTATVDDLCQVMRRHICCHTHSNTVSTIHQQVRNLGWHHGWLFERVVEVGRHINGILFEVVHDVLTHL